MKLAIKIFLPSRVLSSPIDKEDMKINKKAHPVPHKAFNGKASQPDLHKQYQFGTNPMEMTAFEKSHSQGEVQERINARHNYIVGINGRDGGDIPNQQYVSWNPSPQDRVYEFRD